MVRTFSRKQMQAKINTICIYYDLYLHKSRPKSPCPVSEPTHLEVAARIRDKPYQRIMDLLLASNCNLGQLLKSSLYNLAYNIMGSSGKTDAGKLSHSLAVCIRKEFGLI